MTNEVNALELYDGKYYKMEVGTIPALADKNITGYLVINKQTGVIEDADTIFAAAYKQAEDLDKWTENFFFPKEEASPTLKSVN